MSERFCAASEACPKNEHIPGKFPITPEFVRYPPENARLPRKKAGYPEKCQIHPRETLTGIGSASAYKQVYKQGLQTRINISTKARKQPPVDNSRALRFNPTLNARIIDSPRMDNRAVHRPMNPACAQPLRGSTVTHT